MGISTAIIGAAVIAGGAAVYASSQASKAAEAQSNAAVEAGRIQANAAEASSAELAAAQREAAAKQLQASQESIAEQRRQFDETKALLAPWREAGTTAVNKLLALTNAGPGDYASSPGYDWRVGEGIKALDRSASARGRLLSGAQDKAVTKFGQDYATYEYDNFLNRWYKSLEPYQYLSNQGLSATGTTAAAGTNAANNISATTTGTAADVSNALLATQNTINTNRAIAAGAQANALLTSAQARGSGYINQANAYTSAANQTGNNALMYYMLKDLKTK